jgi:two-component system alkaline phosphatase synthesis response regulator PhoP
MSNFSVLCVDDEEDILELLELNLKREGIHVHTAANGVEALEKLAIVKPDLVLLDIMMPKMDGIETCKYIRNKSDSPDVFIYFLTAKSDEIDEILGLEVGADDYIVKPFSPRKIISKIKTVARRMDENAQPKIEAKDFIRVDGIEINRLSYTVSIDGVNIKFLHKEFELLYFLMKRQGIAFSRADLLNHVWEDNVYFIDRTIDVHITKIRKKLGKYSNYIKTISGVGYKFLSEA